MRLRTRSAALAVAFLFLVAGLLLLPPLRHIGVGAVLPFLRLPAMLRAAATGRWRPLSNPERVRLEHSERTVAELELERLRARQAQEENRALRAALDLPLPPEWTRVAAPVLARDPASWDRRFRIGAGRGAGLAPGHAVLSGRSLVGRIESCTEETALVVTLADPTCRLSVYLPARHAAGVLAGRADLAWRGVPLCRVRYLPRDAAYAAGDDVVTSGLGGSMPAGLPVGRLFVGQAGERPVRIIDTVYAEAQLRPAADFEMFHFVTVVVPQRVR
jgi:rod shape-determining protein MreC